MIKKIIKALKKMPLMKGIFPKKNIMDDKTYNPEIDEIDYRYDDFRDEIREVEQMRTIGGKHGKKS